MLAVRWKDSTTKTILPSMVQFKHRSALKCLPEFMFDMHFMHPLDASLMEIDVAVFDGEKVVINHLC